MNFRQLAINHSFHGWRMVGFCTFSQFISMGCSIYILGIYIQPMAEAFAISPGKLGWGMASFYLVNSLAGPVVGTWVDRGKAREVMTLGAAVFGLGLILMGLAAEVIYAALVCIFLLAPGACMLAVLPCATLLVQWFRRRQSFAVGVSAIGVSLGGFLMPPVANALIELLGWRGSLIVLGAVVAAVLMPLAWFTVVGRPADIGQHPDGEAPTEAVSAEPAGEASLSVRRLLGSRAFWLLTATVGFLSTCSIMLVTYIVPYAVASGVSTASSALLISLYAGMAVLGKVLFGWLGDRLSKRLVMILIQALGTGGWLFMVLLNTTPALMLSAGLVGLAVGGMTPIWAALIAQHFGPTAFGRVKGVMTLVMLVFLILPGPLGGYLYDTYGSYATGFAIVWWALPVGLLCAILLPRQVKPAA